MDPDRLSPVVTPRLVLTPIGAEDAPDLAVLYSDPLVARWTGPWTAESVRDWATTMSDRWRTDGVGKWMARDRESGTLVGRGGPSLVALDGAPTLEVGWVVRDALTGRGYATELGRAAFGWAAEHEPHLPVVAFTEVHNRASRAVMERLGMVFDRILFRQGLVEGRDGVDDAAPFVLYRVR